MWVDLNRTSNTPFTGAYDVCVCGSGPAGMTAARRLGRAGARVLLLEAGAMTPTAESMDVYRGESIGPETYYGVESCRLRYFGGTSGHWAGRCSVLDPIDFSARDIWGLPGWPISREEAYVHLREARAILDVAGKNLNRRDEPHWMAARFRPSAFAFSAPTRFGEKFRDELQSSNKIDVALNANVLDAELNDSGAAVTELIVANYDGQEFRVRAKHFIIAFGALENARFLLNANSRVSAGLGNHSDFVGRCFMEHFNTTLGRFISTNPALWNRDAALSLNPAEDLIAREGLGNAVVTLTASASPKFFGRLAPFRRFVRHTTCSSDFLLQRARTKRDIACEGDGVITNIMEQVPNRDSRIIIDHQSTDQFGKPRLAVDWRLAGQDRKTMLGLAREIGMAMAEQNAGRVRISDDVLDGAAPPQFHCHHMGTTRMSADPRFGVVDRNSKIHGLENLYLAGSSVFPTGGGANPTLTIVALALRLGAHLAGQLKLG